MKWSWSQVSVCLYQSGSLAALDRDIGYSSSNHSTLLYTWRRSHHQFAIILRSSVRMRQRMKDSTMIMRPGEFWIADIPFTNATASKRRPVLVLWLDAEDAVVAVVTSAGMRSSTDVSLQEWSASGLRVASTVRLSRLDCLEQSLLLFRLGTVRAIDAERLKNVWASDVRLRF